MPCPSMHEDFTTSQILSYFPPLDENESAGTDNSVLNIDELLHDDDMQLPDVASQTYQDPSLEAYIAEGLCRDPVKPFQHNR